MCINRLQDTKFRSLIYLFCFQKNRHISVFMATKYIGQKGNYLSLNGNIVKDSFVTDEKFRTNRLSVDREISTKLFSWDFCWIFRKSFHYCSSVKQSLSRLNVIAMVTLQANGRK